MQCSPSFDCNWGKQTDPTAHWHQLHPRYPVLQQENVSATHHDAWAGPLNLPIAWAARWLGPLQTPINRSTPTFKIPPVVYI